MAAPDFKFPEESLNKLLSLYTKNRRDDLEKIRQGLKASDFSQVAEGAHRIRGTSACFGHARFGDLAAKLEKSALECTADECALVAKELAYYFEQNLVDV